MNRCSLLFLWILTSCLFLAGPAPADDTIGIFWDTGYTENSILTDTFPSIHTGYLVLKNPTSMTGVLGWECCVRIQGPAIFVSWVLEGHTLNLETEPCFLVGISPPPLPGGDAVLLATFMTMVSEEQPVTFSLEPLFHSSLPDQMAYIPADDPGSLLPMTTVTGFPGVASINGDVTFLELDRDHVIFGNTILGYPKTETVTVSNLGYVDVEIEIALTDTNGAFFLTGPSGLVTVPARDTLAIQVMFDPPSAEYYFCTLSLGNLLPEVLLEGTGLGGTLDWEMPLIVDFGDLAVGDNRIRSLTIENTGDVPIPVTPSLPDTCSAFSLDFDVFPTIVGPGNSHTIRIIFEPLAVQAYSCKLGLGEVLPEVALVGAGRDTMLSWEAPTQLDFDAIMPGSTQIRYFYVVNTGEIPFTINPSLPTSCSEFEITSGEELIELDPGLSHRIHVQFSPTVPGSFHCVLDLGEVVPPVSLTGVGGTLAWEAPSDLDFGPVSLGDQRVLEFFIYNTGGLPFTIRPRFLDPCSEFEILAGGFREELALGESHQVFVRFTPVSLDTASCFLDLGDVVPAVYCWGTAVVDVQPGENLVGLFFDQEYTAFETRTSTSPEIVTGYLVLSNLSNPSGVGAWECAYDLSGNGQFMDWRLEGQAINVGSYNNLIVGIGESPLPFGPTILLATFQLLVPNPSEKLELFLKPTQFPSIPGQMAWAPWDPPGVLLPMLPLTGVEAVAWVNRDVVAVERPAPLATLNGSEVRIEWAASDDQVDGYHVYRRDLNGNDTRLTSLPMRASGSRLVFTDSPSGYDAGAMLYYSYTVVRNKVESARSLETEVKLDIVIPATTRLQANIPNPFNPSTRIHFELARRTNVTVAVYDITGRLVRTLVNENLNAGRHSELWQGRDRQGRLVPSGSYYVRLVTEGRVDSRKILLLK
jgi:hypothetical protein